MPQPTIEDMIRDKYHDDNVAAHILSEVQKNGNGDKIVSGELVLPHPEDAKRHMEATKQQNEANALKPQDADEEKRLQARLDQLRSRRNVQQH